MNKYGSLYIFSTQGMEKLHYQARGVFFKKTRHGSGRILLESRTKKGNRPQFSENQETRIKKAGTPRGIRGEVNHKSRVRGIELGLGGILGGYHIG